MFLIFFHFYIFDFYIFDVYFFDFYFFNFYFFDFYFFDLIFFLLIFFNIIYLLLLPLTFLPHNSPLINIDMMVGVDVSNPAKLSVFLSFGSAIVKQLLVIPTTMSLASIPMTARYCSSAT